MSWASRLRPVVLFMMDASDNTTRLQAMVPYWDALNHITGYVNVRLNHHTGR
jgi:hypothetical protein